MTVLVFMYSFFKISNFAKCLFSGPNTKYSSLSPICETFCQIATVLYVYACSVAQLCPLFVTAQTVAHQAPVLMGLLRQEYWSGWHFLRQGIFPTQGQEWLAFPTPKDLPDSGIEPRSPASPPLAGKLFTTEPPVKPKHIHYIVKSKV